MNSIKTKLRAAFLLVIAIATFGAITSYFFVEKAMRFQAEKQDVESLLLQFEKMRRAEHLFVLYGRKDVKFLEEGTSTSLEEHQQHLQETETLLGKLETGLVGQSADLQLQIDAFKRYILFYSNHFGQLVGTYRLRGFKDHGLEGDMRELVHGLQACTSAEEKVLAFSLRRHEKDFMLRKDPKYVEKLHVTAQQFTDMLQADAMPHMTENYVRQQRENIAKYVAHFDRIVAIERKIGLKEDEGIQGQIQEVTADLKPIGEKLFAGINQKSDELKATAQTTLAIFTILPLLLGGLLSFYFTKIFAVPVIALNKALQQYIGGEHEVSLDRQKLSPKNEIKDLFDNFQTLLDEVKQNLADITGKNAALEQKAIEDEKRGWISEGLGNVGDLLSDQRQELAEMAYQVVSFLVKYTQSSAGGLFLVNEHQKAGSILELTASYAFDRRKYNQKTVQLGEGLAGAAWFEKQAIYQTEVPTDYLEVTSGMGGAKPTELLILPLIAENEVIGVLELASLHSLEGANREFLDQASEKIASSIAFFKAHGKTRQLLQESKIMTEQLRASEEELRQNMEELQATQEEMERKSGEMKAKADSHANTVALQEMLIAQMSEGYIAVDANLQVTSMSKQLAGKLSMKTSSAKPSPLFSLIGQNEEIADALEKASAVKNGKFEVGNVEIEGNGGILYHANVQIGKIEAEKTSYVLVFKNLKRSFTKAKTQLSYIPVEDF